MQTNSNHPLRAPSIQHMSMDSNRSHSSQQTAKSAAQKLGNATLNSSQNKKIIAFCNQIKNSSPAISVNLRKSFAEFLSKENIRGLDTMSPTQRKLCAWVLLERVARDDAPLAPTNPAQIRSFIRNHEDRQAIGQVSNLLSLDPTPYLS